MEILTVLDLDPHLEDVLVRCRVFVSEINQAAEAKHDDMLADTYMDHGQWEIMDNTERLIKDIDDLLEVLKRQGE